MPSETTPLTGRGNLAVRNEPYSLDTPTKEPDWDLTVILAHGAYVDSSGWNDIIGPLVANGHRIIAWAKPLRGIATDAVALTSRVRSLDGPIVLVGHSYGAAVLTNVDCAAGDTIALVYVAGFALEAGESPTGAPDSTLADTPTRTPRDEGGGDMYIATDKFHRQVAGPTRVARCAHGRHPVPRHRRRAARCPASFCSGALSRAGSSWATATATSPWERTA